MNWIWPRWASRPCPQQRAALVITLSAAQDIHLWLSQSIAVKPAAFGARGAAKRRTDVADRPFDTGLQDHRQLPQRQRAAITGVCRQFVLLFQRLGLFADALVAVDGSKFKAVNGRDRNFTSAKLQRRMEEITANIIAT